MAVLALGFVGSAIGAGIGGTVLGISAATIGGYIGATAGGLIDNMLFAPSFSQEGPRLGDLEVTSSAYGEAIPRFWGPSNRTAGKAIWYSGLKETATVQEQGGKGGGGSVTTTTYSYAVDIALLIGEGEISALKRIWANGKLIYDADAAGGETHAVFDVLRFYPGNGTQNPDPTMEAALGAGNVPAYRHTAYVVLTDLQLADFGNTLPNIEMEIEAQASKSVGAAVKEICALAGVPEVSTFALTDVLDGYAIARDSTAAAALQPLAVAYDFDVAQQRGAIRAVKRGLGIRAHVPAGLLGARDAAEDGGDPITYDRMAEYELPREVTVTARDPDLDYQLNSQSARWLGGSANANIAQELPLVLGAAAMRRIADRLLFGALSGRRRAGFSLDDRWLYLNAGDVLGIDVPAGGVMPFSIRRATRGANGAIECEGRFEDPEVYSSTAAGAAGNLPENALELPGETRFQPMDAPMLRSQDDNEGFYWAVTAESSGWRGADIKQSGDGGVSYSQMSAIGVRAAIGDVATALGDGPTHVWDEGNTLDVVLTYEGNELESASAVNVLNGANAAWLGPAGGQGGEVLLFREAVLIAANTYRLSGLLRGRRGTEHAVGGHGPNEIFVALQTGTLGRTNFGAGDWNQARQFKPVSRLTTEADTSAVSFTNTGEAKRPLSPVHVAGSRDGGNDLTLTWVRRSRIPQPGLGNGPLPLGEETESYEIDILSGASVLRTIAASTATATYTAAEQAADGLTPGDPVSVEIYQLSASRGRGHAAAATV